MQITETVLDFQPGKPQLLEMEGMLSGQARWEVTPEGEAQFDIAVVDSALSHVASEADDRERAALS